MCAASPARRIRPAWKRLGGLGNGAPLVDVQNVDLQLGIADRVANHLHGHLIGHGVGDEPCAGIVDVANGEDDEEAAETGLLQPEEAAQRRVGDVDHAEVAPTQGLRAIGTEVDRDAARQQAMADHLDAEALADRAAVAVTGHHVSRADLLLAAVVDVANRGGHSIVVLLVADELGRVLEAGTELAARCSRIGSSTCCGMNSRRAGLTSSTPALMFGM